MTDGKHLEQSERLSHLDDEGRARMIDVGAKPITHRVAVAGGRLQTTPEVIALVRADDLPKADVLATARIAGIAAAKRTSELIPLAHLLPLDGVTIDFELRPDGDPATIEIRASVSVTARTGVEMEALTAVALAGLTLHDMIKVVDPSAVLGEIKLLSKSGGKRGYWTRPLVEPVENHDAQPAVSTGSTGVARGRAVVIVSSTGAANGSRADTTGPVLTAWLTANGFTPDPVIITADAAIATAIEAAIATHPAVLLTTGGTGIHPQDRTPEATRAVLDQELPGIAEAIRTAGRASTPTAALSRATAGVAGGTIVVNLPGSPGGVRDGLTVLDQLLPHLIDQLAGGGHDHG